jgi:hypothetical protein
MRLNPLLGHALAFQAGWLACVIGGNPWAMAAAIVLLPLYLLATRPGWSLCATLIAIALAGLAMDLAWQAAGLLRFNGTSSWGLPPWLASLWLLFAASLTHALRFLHHRLGLAALLGAIAGPLSYLAGLGFGAASTVHPHHLVGLALAPAWALLLPLFLILVRQNPEVGQVAARTLP